MAYVPALHNAVGRLGRLTTSRAGEFQFAAADWRLALNDVSDRPELWLRTLSILTSTIQDLMPAPIRPGSRLRDRDPATADLALELIGRLGEEYDAFLVRHGEVPRPMPAMPPMNTADDERRWAEANAADLARDPTWGRRVRRLLDDDLAAFRKYALELR